MIPGRHPGSIAVAVAFAFACLLAAAAPGRARADLIVNGGFEAGFTGWTRADLPGSEGGFSIQTGTTSPVNGDPVPAPPSGTFAAMSDGGGPGSHVLYQDFVVPTAPAALTLLQFSLFIGNRAGQFSTPSPASLDFSINAFNQQVRVDILRAGTNPFSVASADVLQNVYQTRPGDPLVSGYTAISSDITAVFLANAGQTLRLRFAETDNAGPFQLGVDAVSVTPEPSSMVLAGTGLAALVYVHRKRKGKPTA